MHKVPICFLALICSFSVLSQPIAPDQIDLVSGDIPAEWKMLLLDKEQIESNDIANEQILDLVEVYTLDSVYSRKTERHQFVGAALLPVFGFRWKTVRYTREKWVGTVVGNSLPGKERLTEYDVNFNIAPNLPHYRQMSYEAHQAQAEMFKARKKVKEDKAPWIPPEDNDAIKPYKIHCECTPDAELRQALNQSFYPTISPYPLEEHPNIGQAYPSMGMYGPLILDCNHHCHPEIHPYEWLWWLDVGSEGNYQADQQVWWVGFFRDVSKRFKHWSSSPRSGQIQIPFVWQAEADSFYIQIEHRVFDGFNADGFSEIDIPEQHYSLSEKSRSFEFLHPMLALRKVNIELSYPLKLEGISYWISDLKYDQEENLIFGYFNLAASIEDLYTFKFSTGNY
jgi:hypothetical protein